MDYYQEIILRPDTEIPLNFIWSKFYLQLHLSLVEQQNKEEPLSIGVSFPDYQLADKSKDQQKTSLGTKLRVFAKSEAELISLNLAHHLSRLEEYALLSAIKKVPQTATYAIYQRYRPKIATSKIRRHAKRQGISFSEALERFCEAKEKTSHLPYIKINSLSNQNLFYLFIDKKPTDKKADHGFGTYGLSQNSTVPEF